MDPVGDRGPDAMICSPRMHRFGAFQFDVDRLELFRDGCPVRLQPQPAQVLATLIASAGRTVAREQLRQAVWGGDTFVDFERGLNFCIAQIRSALRDEAALPRYVQTVPKRGYKFVCPVHEDAREGHDAHREGQGILLGWLHDSRRWWVVAATTVLAVLSFFGYRALISRAVPIVA